MGLKPRTPNRPPIPAFIVEAARREGVAPEVLEERMIADLARLLRPDDDAATGVARAARAISEQ